MGPHFCSTLTATEKNAPSAEVISICRGIIPENATASPARRETRLTPELVGQHKGKKSLLFHRSVMRMASDSELCPDFGASQSNPFDGEHRDTHGLFRPFCRHRVCSASLHGRYNIGADHTSRRAGQGSDIQYTSLASRQTSMALGWHLYFIRAFTSNRGYMTGAHQPQVRRVWAADYMWTALDQEA